MELMLWLGATALVFLAVTIAAPHHIRMIENRPKIDKSWD
jgi:hypothetical protein